MNIFSNLGITEIVIILLLALVVVGPERLPEMGRKLGKTLRDVRKAYDSLTRDLGPELTSIQQTTQELRESVDAVRSIPQNLVQSVVSASEMEETFGELKDTVQSVGKVRDDLTAAAKVVRDPLAATVSTARSALAPATKQTPPAGAGGDAGAKQIDPPPGQEPQDRPSPVLSGEVDRQDSELLDRASGPETEDTAREA